MKELSEFKIWNPRMPKILARDIEQYLKKQKISLIRIKDKKNELDKFLL